MKYETIQLLKRALKSEINTASILIEIGGGFPNKDQYIIQCKEALIELDKADTYEEGVIL